MFSSGFGLASAGGTGRAELSGSAFGCAVRPLGSEPAEWCAASSEAEDSGTGDVAGVAAGTSRLAAADGSGTGGGGGAGSCARGVFTDVSPVNGFLYSLCGVMTSSALGLKPVAGAGALGAAVAECGRLPRARPDPRVAPNWPTLTGPSVAGLAETSAEWPVFAVASAGWPGAGV